MQDTVTKFALCHHIHTAGNRCGSPALRGEEFCYFHHPTRRPRRGHGRKPRLPIFHLPNFDDRESVQRAFAKVVSRTISGRLDPQRAGLFLFILRLANQTFPSDSRELDTLIQQAQANLAIADFQGLSDILATIRPHLRHKKCPGSRPIQP
jgi:hypothetical protein